MEAQLMVAATTASCFLPLIKTTCSCFLASKQKVASSTDTGKNKKGHVLVVSLLAQ